MHLGRPGDNGQIVLQPVEAVFEVSDEFASISLKEMTNAREQTCE